MAPFYVLYAFMFGASPLALDLWNRRSMQGTGGKVGTSTGFSLADAYGAWDSHHPEKTLHDCKTLDL